jgi:hypothetical protein
MLIRPTELEIPENDPFQNDALKRKKLEPPLTQFVTQASGSLVMALDGEWGSGKTTFLKMWQPKLTKAGHVCLYLNVWKTDFTQEPLVAITSELSSVIEDFAVNCNDGKSLQKHIKKAREMAGKIAKRSIPLAIKVLTAGLIHADDFIEETTAEFASDAVEAYITSFESAKSEIEEFRKTLTDLVEQVQEIQQESSKVVIIIDELDRCRPTYAVQILERIKHLFDVPGVIFILGINRSQLNYSIQAIYGSGFDAQRYLKRFIDIDFQLPESEPGDYCSYLLNRFGIRELMVKNQNTNQQSKFDELNLFLGYFMSSAGMSLRDQEQMVARLRIVLQTIPRGESRFPMQLSFLLFLREWNSDTYNALIKGVVDIEDFLAHRDRLPRLKETSEKVKFYVSQDIFEALILAAASDFGVNSDRLKNYENIVNAGSESADFRKANKILEYINLCIGEGNYGTLGFKTTVQRLSLTNHFISYE